MNNGAWSEVACPEDPPGVALELGEGTGVEHGHADQDAASRSQQQVDAVYEVEIRLEPSPAAIDSRAVDPDPGELGGEH